MEDIHWQGFGGGPLTKETGDRLVKECVPLSVVYGSYVLSHQLSLRHPFIIIYDRTEAGIVARFFPGMKFT